MRASSRSSTWVEAWGFLRIFGFDLGLEFLGTELVHQDLDARLILVVAASIEIVDAHDRFEIADQLMLRQEVAHGDADHRRAAQAAADDHFPANRTFGVAVKPQADVVHLDGGAVIGSARYRDLELARQEGKFGMERRPLPQAFRQPAADRRSRPLRHPPNDRS